MSNLQGGPLGTPISVSLGGTGISMAVSTVSTSGNINALATSTGKIILTGASPQINGIVAPSTPIEVELIFTGSTSLTLSHNSGSATAADRLHCPGTTNVRIFPNNAVTLVYDQSISRWRILSASGAIYNTSTVTNNGIVIGVSNGQLQQVTSATADGSGNVSTSSGGAFRSDYYQTISGVLAIDTASGYIYDSATVISFDYYNRTIYDLAAVPSGDFRSRFLSTSVGSVALNWESRNAINSSNNPTIDWETHYLYSKSVGVLLDWSGDTGTINFPNASTSTFGNAATLNNSPSAGDPAEWWQVTINGNQRWIPVWA